VELLLLQLLSRAADSTTVTSMRENVFFFEKRAAPRAGTCPPKILGNLYWTSLLCAIFSLQESVLFYKILKCKNFSSSWLIIITLIN